MIKIAITTGDPDGIGFEIAAKALSKMGPSKDFQYFLFRSNSSRVPESFYAKYVRLVRRKWKIVRFSDLRTALIKCSQYDSSYLIEIQSPQSAPEWVVDSTKACLSGQLDGICTAPLSKTLINEAGLSDRGHTEIFKRISKVKNVNMGFIGSKFNVLLMTDHIPLKNVAKTIQPKLLSSSIQNALMLRSVLPKNLRNRPFGLLGINPHAGESGLLGAEEQRLVSSINKLTKSGTVSDFLPPDVAFLKKNWSKFSVFIAAYHDQGLIPFKMIHGQDSGVHISFGLPFVRTSVDHGTAKDIFGQNKANPQSMLEALQWCQKLTKLKVFRQNKS